MKLYIAVAVTIISVVAIMAGILIYRVTLTSSPERYFNKAKRNFELANYQEAINDLNEYLAIEAGRNVIGKPSENIAEAQFIIAESLEKLKKYVLAKEKLASIINDPSFTKYIPRAILAYANITRLSNEADYYIMGKLEEYLKYPQSKLIESQMNMFYGYQLFFLKRYGEALSYFLRTDGELATLGRARVYHSMKEESRAFEVYEDFIRYYPSSVYYEEVVRTYLIQVPALAYKEYITGNYTRARFYYEKIVDLFPNTEESEESLFRIAQIYYESKNYNSAIKYYDMIIANNINTLNAEATLYKGLSYFKLDRYNDSFKILDDFVLRYPAHANVAQAKKYLDSLREILLAIN